MRKIERIILHCSATSKPTVTAAQVNRWHTDPKPKGYGWKQPGYHYFIRTSGQVEKMLKFETVANGVYGYNKSSIHICLNGLDIRDFKEVQFVSLESVLKRLHKKFPLATIHPHYELDVKKECPVYSIDRFRMFWVLLQS